MSKEYKELTESNYRSESKELLAELPKFCKDFFQAKQLSLADSTRNLYIRQMKIFLQFLHDEIAVGPWKKEIKEYTYEDIEKLTYQDANDFVTFLLEQNISRETIVSYVGTLSSYWAFFIKSQDFLCNIWAKVEKPKKKQKELIYLKTGEQKNSFMESVTYGKGLTKRELSFHSKSDIRDLAICSLICNTGIRVSELVGLDIDDLHLDRHMIDIVTKGNNEVSNSISDANVELLKEYLIFRQTLNLSEENKALFVSINGKTKGHRLTPRGVQFLIKKYALTSGIEDSEKITPHKLRSTAAMSLLEKSGDITVVKELLHHKDIRTTQIYSRAQTSTVDLYRNDI